MHTRTLNRGSVTDRLEEPETPCRGGTPSTRPSLLRVLTSRRSDACNTQEEPRAEAEGHEASKKPLALLAPANWRSIFGSLVKYLDKFPGFQAPDYHSLPTPDPVHWQKQRWKDICREVTVLGNEVQEPAELVRCPGVAPAAAD